MSVSIHLCDTCGREDKNVIWNDFSTGPMHSFAKDLQVCDECARDLGGVVKARAKALREIHAASVPSRVPSVAQIVRRWLKVLTP